MKKPWTIPVFATSVCLSVLIVCLLGGVDSGSASAETRNSGTSPFHLSQLQRIPLEANEPQAMLTVSTEHAKQEAKKTETQTKQAASTEQAKHNPSQPKHPVVLAQDSAPEKASPDKSVSEKTAPEKPVSLNTVPASQTSSTEQSPDQTEGFHPAVNTQVSPPAAASGNTFSQLLQKVGIGKSVALQPLGAIAVFPVYQGGGKKAFEDLPVVLADEFARFLEGKASGTRVFNPLYTVEEFKVRGLGGVYDKVIHYYIRARRPEPKALQYLVKQLTADGRPVERVVFVESDFDMNHVADPSSITDRMKGWTTDALPKVGRYHVKSRVQVFDVTQPDVPMVWSYSWNYPVKASEFPTLTSSVFSTPDATRVLSRSSRWISREILPLVPHRVYANVNEQPTDDQATQKDVKAQVLR